MRTGDLPFILGPPGLDILEQLAAVPPTPETHLSVAERLRSELGAELASAVLETALLRQRAARKFSRANQMVFTREGLEQATAEPVAQYRARRYAAAGLQILADLGCGIGGDAVALAATGATIVAIDQDLLHVAMARANAVVYDAGAKLLPVVADLLELPPLVVEGFFFDPARRTPAGRQLPPGRRLRSVADYRPPLSLINRWRPVVPHGAVKVSPGIDYAEIPADAECEFISLDGEVKEATLWFGDLRTGARRRATLLPDAVSLTDSDEQEPPAAGPPRSYLYEPDGAVIRAHLVGTLARQLNASLIDPHIAYLTADTALPTPFAHCYQLEDHFPFQLKRLRAYLRDRDVGEVTIKKRGSPLDPDILRQALRLRGHSHLTVILTQVMGQPTVLIGRPCNR